MALILHTSRELRPFTPPIKKEKTNRTRTQPPSEAHIRVDISCRD